MKKIYNALKYSAVFLSVVIMLTSCDKEFSSIESSVLGEGNFNFNANDSEFPITTYNKKLDSLQINGLSSSLLGIYDDPAYGRISASIVTQVTPTVNDPDFGTDPQIESVILTIPYFSTQTGVTDEAVPEYRLDSLFHKSNDPAMAEKFRLTIYENNYFLRNFNPNDPDNSTQNYFSKSEGTPNPSENFVVTGSELINFDQNAGTMLFSDSEFIPSNAAKATVTGTGDDEVTTYSSPVIELDLAPGDTEKGYWKTLILDKAGQPELSNANNFRNYFRGLYIKAEAVDDSGSMVLLNLADSNANITITYTSENETDGEDRVEGTYSLNFIGTRLNTFRNDFSMVPLANGDKTNGDETLYLKGTSGSMAVINLFDGLVDCDEDGEVNDDALDCLKNKFRKKDDQGEFVKENGWFVLQRLINEAQIIVYEDEIMSSFAQYPNGDDHTENIRLYLYDLKNNTPVVDYFSDPTDNLSDPLNSKIFSFGRRTKNDAGDAMYKLRVTDHLNNILLRDSTNVKLGLVLSTNVNEIVDADILDSGDDATTVPTSSIIAPKGTILHGSNSNDPDKRLRFEIFFTEPKK